MPKFNAKDKGKLQELAKGFKGFDATTALTSEAGNKIGKRIELLLNKINIDINKQIKEYETQKKPPNSKKKKT